MSKPNFLVKCRYCQKGFLIRKDRIRKDGNCCTQKCAAIVRWQNRTNTNKKWSGGGGWVDYQLKSTVLHCDECGHNYLDMHEYNSECYLCINKMRNVSYDYVN